MNTPLNNYFIIKQTMLKEKQQHEYSNVKSSTSVRFVALFIETLFLKEAGDVVRSLKVYFDLKSF